MRYRIHPLIGLAFVACVAGPQRDPQRSSSMATANGYAHFATAAVQPPDSVTGCYRASRPLGTAASPTGGTPTPGLDTFQLLPEGRVDRPHVGTPVGWTDRMAANARESWRRGSRWTATPDSLHVRLSTGLAGWELRLARVTGDPFQFEGMGHYLTDVVVVDGSWKPPVVAVRVRREPCADVDLPE
jgi:hypothetical protein